MPYVLRQLASTMVPGAQAELYNTPASDYRFQMIDVPSRQVLALGGSGQYSLDFLQIAANASLVLPPPPNYAPPALLWVGIVTDQSLKVTAVTDAGTQTFMVRAGLASDQPGQCIFMAKVTSITLLCNPSTAANVEVFQFQLPAITTNAGWQQGSLATGLLGP